MSHDFQEAAVFFNLIAMMNNRRFLFGCSDVVVHHDPVLPLFLEVQMHYVLRRIYTESFVYLAAVHFGKMDRGTALFINI